MTRQDLIGRLWENSLVFIARKDFAAGLEGWDLDPVFNAAGDLAVIFLVRGPEFHFCKLDPSYQAGRDVLRRYPGELIARHGYATTKTPKNDTRQLRFNLRLGFYQVGEDEHDAHLRIDQFRKEKSCQ